MRTFTLTRLAEILFAIPWIVFGIQHYMYADFVSTLVPAYVPAHLFWVYFTGTAMLAAGVAILLRKQVRLAAFLLACMLLLFILMLHTILLSTEPKVALHWTRFLQDTAIMGAALGLSFNWQAPASAGASSVPKNTWPTFASSGKAAVIARCCYALPLIPLGAQHFTHNAFVTAKVPAWFPAVDIFDYIIGIILIAAAIALLFTVNLERITLRTPASAPGSLAPNPHKPNPHTLHPYTPNPHASNTLAGRTARLLGLFLLLMFLLQHAPLLIKDPHSGFEWTGSMLDLALAAGAFIISGTTRSLPAAIPTSLLNLQLP